MAIGLDLILADSPGLEEEVEISVSGAPLAEFIRALGTQNKVNISVSSEVQGTVSNTFNSVTVRDILLFLAEQNQLNLSFTGNIIHVSPYIKPPPPPTVKIAKALTISYDTSTAYLSLDLRGDTLAKVAKTLTKLTGRNLVFSPKMGLKQVSIYLENVGFDQAMDKMAFANQLQISKTEDGFYLIENGLTQQESQNSDNSIKRFRDLKRRSSGLIQIDSNGISLNFKDEPMMSLLESIFSNLGKQYFLYDQIPGNATLNLQNVQLEDLLNHLFEGTDYSYLPKGDIYLIGNRDLEGLMESRTIGLLNRSVEKVLEYIPRNVLKDIEVKELAELNSLVVSGSYPKVKYLEDFIKSIDQPVPVVIIEVIIVDYQRNFNVSTGIEAGIGDQPAASSGGGVYPGVDYNLNSQSLNEIIQSFNGFGTLNLGPVTPNFYLNLKFLETNGLVNVRSTPKLSTLNGHEATLSIGNTEYYVVEQVNIQGVQNPIPTTTRNFQSVEANFTLTVKPMVSSEDQVTLEIEVEQSDFTSRISPEAPPGNVSRKFSSMIRVRNNEVVLLGGLEEKGYNDTGSGIPVLSRIPWLKWLFSSRNRSDTKSKLNVFIKPVIIY
ncbi:MAG: type II and III secretion system protein [Bacteroidetes bacterium]|nr:type II and III secretion system protein [Bacteroidota bacterium]